MPSKENNPNDRDALIRDAWRRLARLEIETHRIKAVLARLRSIDEDQAADDLARLLAEHPDDLAFASALSSYVVSSSYAARSMDPGPLRPLEWTDRAPKQAENDFIAPGVAIGMQGTVRSPVSGASRLESADSAADRLPCD